MQPEHPPTINSETFQNLQAAIFGAEISTLQPEYAAMFNAENNACFKHFIETLDEGLKDESARAERGDLSAITLVGEAYHTFRDLMESELSQNDPDGYNTFIEAVASGDERSASSIVDDFYLHKQIANEPIIDDELDVQFT